MDSEVIEVAQAPGRICTARRSTPQVVFSKIIARTLDEVIDGPRTGRYRLVQLEKTEKTYVGTKLEIIIRAELELEKGDKTDVIVAGHPVDIKWSQDLGWMIAPENVNRICLGVGLHDEHKIFQKGSGSTWGP